MEVQPLGDVVERPRLRLHVDARDVLTDDARCNELHSAEDDDGGKERRPPHDAVVPKKLASDDPGAQAKAYEREREAKRPDVPQWFARESGDEIERVVEKLGEAVVRCPQVPWRGLHAEGADSASPPNEEPPAEL